MKSCFFDVHCDRLFVELVKTRPTDCQPFVSSLSSTLYFGFEVKSHLVQDITHVFEPHAKTYSTCFCRRVLENCLLWLCPKAQKNPVNHIFSRISMRKFSEQDLFIVHKFFELNAELPKTSRFDARISFESPIF